MARCRLVGDWGKLKNFSKNFDKELIKSAKSLSAKEATRIQGDIKQVIHSQSQPWEALKPSTIAGKGHNKALYETGSLVNSINVSKRGALVYLIQPEGNHPSGLSNQEIGAFHEFGTQIIPPRPFIRPVYKSYTKQLPLDFKAMVEEVIAKFK